MLTVVANRTTIKSLSERKLFIMADAFKFMGVVPDYEANEHNGQHAITKTGSLISFKKSILI